MTSDPKISGVLSHAVACLAHNDDIDLVNSGHLLREYAALLSRMRWTDAVVRLPKVDVPLLVCDARYPRHYPSLEKETAFLRYVGPDGNPPETWTEHHYWELPFRETAECEWSLTEGSVTHWMYLPDDPEWTG